MINNSTSKTVIILYKQDPDNLQRLINEHIDRYCLVGGVCAVATVNGLLWYATMQLRSIVAFTAMDKTVRELSE